MNGWAVDKFEWIIHPHFANNNAKMRIKPCESAIFSMHGFKWQLYLHEDCCSDDEDSPHYDDQMEKYSKFQTKKMSFNRDWVLNNSKRIYNPR